MLIRFSILPMPPFFTRLMPLRWFFHYAMIAADDFIATPFFDSRRISMTPP
jgi:hypothetical protein